MLFLINKSIQSIDSLKHFYEAQKKYINQKSQKGMKENKMGYLADFYFNVLTHGTEEEKSHPTIVNLKEALDKHIDILEVTDRGVRYSITSDNPELFTNIKKSSKEYRKYHEMPIIHGNNTLIMLITKFEEFIADVITYIYEKYPNKYLNHQTITFFEIESNGVDTIKNIIVDREVDHIMRDSYMEWFALLADHKINLCCCSKELETLKELYARRNILVHNSGEVNDIYIKNVPNTSFELGDKLYAGDQYLRKAFETIKTIIYCIMIEAIKLDKKQKSMYVDNIFLNAFEELVAGNYHTCETVFSCIYNSGYTDEETKQMARINYWIAKIENEGLNSVRNEVQAFDVSALEKKFILAKVVLLEEYSRANGLIEELCNKGELDTYAVEEWPLFKGYRKTQEYQIFKNSHPELFDILTSDTQLENSLQDKETTKNVKAELTNS